MPMEYRVLVSSLKNNLVMGLLVYYAGSLAHMVWGFGFWKMGYGQSVDGVTRLSSPRLQLPEEEIHHEASTSKQKEDDVVMEIKDDQSDNEDIDAWANSILHANRNVEGVQEPFATIPRSKMKELYNSSGHKAIVWLAATMLVIFFKGLV
ncbi:hypothetical protein MRB53_009662 [Persea americana]|uniref:Uncharacterized protein n=1 Tax=Persea americana TaxID=3435 RepID=A0ACC2LPV5_PERAE|nr:hypothetical protein MRB53_009662 [Persea americana]